VSTKSALLLGVVVPALVSVFALDVPDASAQQRRKGTKAVVVEFPTGGSPTTADFLYHLNSKRALNLSLGLGIDIESEEDTVISMEVNVGYRMYEFSRGRAMPYLEPFAGVFVGELGDGDTIALQGGARLGVEFPIYKQFTLGAYLAATLAIENSFDTIALGVSTGAITAAFYWD